MNSLESYIERSEHVLQKMRAADFSKTMEAAVDILVSALSQKKPVLLCGNGGSASDAEHIAGELVGRFLKERDAFNVISLVSNAAVMTAWSNDYEYDTVFSRQVQGHGAEGGVLLGISTSGNSGNVVKAAEMARQMNMRVITLTGEGGGKLAPLSDVSFAIPSRETALVQQGHITLYHYLCYVLEERLAQAST